MACNGECKLGCSGPHAHQCNDCRASKIYLKDVKKLIDEQLIKYSSEFSSSSSSTNNQLDEEKYSLLNGDTKEKIERLNDILMDDSLMDDSFTFQHLVKSYIQYLLSRNESTDGGGADEKSDMIVFCLNDCPYKMPHKNKENFCSER